MAGGSFVEHVLELLDPVGPTRARAMMGGWMLYCRSLPMALIADERLYLKVDDRTKAAFAEAGGEPFTYEQRGRRIEMSYWTPPDSALDDAESMQPWAELAVSAAARAKTPARSRLRSGPSGVSGAEPPTSKTAKPTARSRQRANAPKALPPASRSRSK